ncbi:Cytochrome P450 [Mycena kentingensis (nom. inval.)]|nr:Cytochrome P450 [Mycena kentingensis (nom. inval.)]
MGRHLRLVLFRHTQIDSPFVDSDVIHMQVGGMSTIILDSMEAIREMLDVRSSSYSDRTRLPMAVELSGWDWAISLMPYGETWRKHRKMMHESFNVVVAKQFRPQLIKSTNALLERLVGESDRVLDELRLMAGSFILDVAYGIKVKSTDDPYMHIVETAMDALSYTAIYGSFLVDYLPALKYLPGWIPGCGFRRKAAIWYQASHDLIEKPFAETLRNMASDSESPSFTAKLIREGAGKADPERNEIIRNTAGIIYAGAAETTVSTLGWFVLAMLKHPEVQRKAQAEVDAVLGHGALPRFEDRPMLPYVEAVVKEVLRWKPVTPLAVPHMSSLDYDDEFRGFRIPAGAEVVGNAWAVLQDETTYPEPTTFNPERFLRDGKLDPTVQDPEVAAFGFGRRMCPGRHLAIDALWINIASIIATLNIEKCVDKATGSVLEPSYEGRGVLVVSPVPFKCKFTVRSAQSERAIQAANLFSE